MDLIKLTTLKKDKIAQLSEKLATVVIDNYEALYPADQCKIELLVDSYIVNEEIISKWLRKQFSILHKDYGGSADILADVQLLLELTVPDSYWDSILSSL